MNSTPSHATDILTEGRGGGGSTLVYTLLFRWIERPKPNLELLGPPGACNNDDDDDDDDDRGLDDCSRDNNFNS